MAFRRNLITRAKLFNQQRFTPSFQYIHHHNDTEDSKTLTPQPKPQYFLQNRSFVSTGVFNTIYRHSECSNLGNSMLNGSILARHMSSSTIGEGTGNLEYMTDVTGVLSDGSVDVVTQQAPVVSEVAVAAADSYFPVAALQHVIDYIHTYTGLPWWGSIVATTLLIRWLAVPLMINQLKITSKLTLMRPKLEEIKQEMQDRLMDEFEEAKTEAKAFR